MSRKFKISDATKDELIQYFFQVDTFGGGFRIPANKDAFLIWLQKKRCDELISEQASVSDALCAALREYTEFVKLANDESDFEKKMALFDKARRAWRKYERFNAKYDELNKKIDTAWED